MNKNLERRASLIMVVLGSCLLTFAVSNATVAQTRAEREAANDLLNEGYKQFQAGILEEAIVNFEMALEIDPANSLAHFHAADVYEAAGQTRKMKASWEKALHLGEGTAHGVKARLKLKRWNDIHDQAHRQAALVAFEAKMSGTWCSPDTSEWGQDANGMNWVAKTFDQLNVALEDDLLREDESRWISLGVTSFVISSQCVGQAGCTKPEPGLSMESKPGWAVGCVSKSDCFDFGFYDGDTYIFNTNDVSMSIKDTVALYDYGRFPVLELCTSGKRDPKSGRLLNCLKSRYFYRGGHKHGIGRASHALCE